MIGFETYKEDMLEGLSDPRVLKALNHLFKLKFTPHRSEDLELYRLLRDRQLEMIRDNNYPDVQYVSFSEVLMHYAERLQTSGINFEQALHYMLVHLNIPSYNEKRIIEEACWGEIRDTHNMFGLSYERYSEVKGLGFDAELFQLMNMKYTDKKVEEEFNRMKDEGKYDDN